MHCLQWLAVEADSIDEAHDTLMNVLMKLDDINEKYSEYVVDYVDGEEDWSWDGEEPPWFEGYVLGAPRMFTSQSVNVFWKHTNKNTIAGTDFDRVKETINSINNERSSHYEDAWNEYSDFWDISAETSLTEKFMGRVAENPERQFLIPVDFKCYNSYSCFMAGEGERSLIP